MAKRKRMGSDFWRQHSDAWAASGLTQADYCSQQGLSLKTFGRWRTKFAADAVDDATRTPAAPRKSRLVPVLVTGGSAEAPATSTPTVAIRADGQPWVVTVGPGADARALKLALNFLLPALA